MIGDTFVDALGRVVEFPTFYEMLAFIYNDHVLEVFELDEFGANEGYLIIDWDEGDWYYIPNDNTLEEMYIEAYNATLEDAAEHGAYPQDY